MTATGGTAPRAWWREELRSLCEILALTGLAIAQPVLDVFGKSPETFAFRGVSRAGIIQFALVVAFLPPLVLAAGAAITRVAGRRVRRVVQVVVLTALAGLVGLEVAKSALGWQGTPVAVAGAIAAVGFALLYTRVGWARLWVSYLAPVPVLVVVVFLFASPVAKLVGDQGGGSAGAAGTTDLKAKHVVVLLLDEFPSASIMTSEGGIDGALYPHLHALSESATWYRNYSTASTSTTFAVPSILTGSFPKDVDAPVTADYPHNLFTLMAPSYHLDVDETFTRLCPDSLCSVSDEGSGGLREVTADAAKVWREQVSLHRAPSQIAAGASEQQEDRSAAEQKLQLLHSDFGGGIHNAPVRFERFLRGIRGGEAPTLHYLHILEPHQPWEHYPSGTTYPYPTPDPGRVGQFGNIWGPSDVAAALGRQRNVLQAQYADRLVGDTVARLKQQGIYDDTLLVVLADHGIAFTAGEGVRAEDGDAFPAKTWSDIVWPPLLVKAPGQTAGSRNDWDVESIDVLPTIADLAGVKLPWRVDGRSAATGPPRSGQQRTFYKATISPDAKTSRGPRFTVDGDEGLARVIAGGVGHFARGDDPRWSVYRAGPDGEIVGTKASSLPKAPVDGPAPRVDLHDAGAFADVDPESGSVPGLVTGSLSYARPSAEQTRVAIAVNGVIGATTETFVTDANPHTLAAIVPDFLFRKGRNTVEVYAIGPGTDRPGLLELGR